MKAHELARILLDRPDLDVVLTVPANSDNIHGDTVSYDMIKLDLGWAPSGVVSVESFDNPCRK